MSNNFCFREQVSVVEVRKFSLAPSSISNASEKAEGTETTKQSGSLWQLSNGAFWSAMCFVMAATLSGRTVSSILSQRLLHKITKSRLETSLCPVARNPIHCSSKINFYLDWPSYMARWRLTSGSEALSSAEALFGAARRAGPDILRAQTDLPPCFTPPDSVVASCSARC